MSIQEEIQKIMTLEETCHWCENGHVFSDSYDCADVTMIQCSVCTGTGIVVTDFGQKVLDFVKKHTAPGES